MTDSVQDFKTIEAVKPFLNRDLALEFLKNFKTYNVKVQLTYAVLTKFKIYWNNTPIFRKNTNRIIMGFLDSVAIEHGMDKDRGVALNRLWSIPPGNPEHKPVWRHLLERTSFSVSGINQPN